MRTGNPRRHRGCAQVQGARPRRPTTGAEARRCRGPRERGRQMWRASWKERQRFDGLELDVRIERLMRCFVREARGDGGRGRYGERGGVCGRPSRRRVPLRPFKKQAERPRSGQDHGAERYSRTRTSLAGWTRAGDEGARGHGRAEGRESRLNRRDDRPDPGRAQQPTPIARPPAAAFASSSPARGLAVACRRPPTTSSNVFPSGRLPQKTTLSRRHLIPTLPPRAGSRRTALRTTRPMLGLVP